MLGTKGDYTGENAVALVAISSAMASTLTIGVSRTNKSENSSNSYASIEFQVYSPALVVLSMNYSGFLTSYCSAIDAAQPWQCGGYVNYEAAVTQLNGNSGGAAVQVSGSFRYPGGGQVDPSGSCPRGSIDPLFSHCAVTLPPGYYLLEAIAGGNVDGDYNANVSPFSWTTTSTLDVFSGSVAPVIPAVFIADPVMTAPEPVAWLLMLAGLGTLALGRSWRSERALVRAKSYRSRP